MGKLTAISAKAMSNPGRYTDGDGLHLHVRASGKKAWVLRYMRAGKLRDMGLGGFPDVSLAEARVATQEARRGLRAGIDPILARERKAVEEGAPSRTFREATRRLIESRKAGWSNEKHGSQWTATLESYAHPIIGDMHVQDVKTEHVLSILQPIWATKPETASRVRGRIEAVLDAAKTMHWREGENPARWKGHLASLLPRTSKVRQVEHHPSLPYQQLGAFVAALHARGGRAGARAIEFAILTAARSGEVRGATRQELDLKAKVWTVPAARMKSRRVHRVPLSAAAMTFLAGLHVDELEPDELLFPGAKGKVASDMTLTAVLRRMNEVDEGQPVPWADGQTGEPITAHGFRSSFRVWAGEQTSHPRELIEMALAHSVGSPVEAAYARTDLVERRRPMMDEWGEFVSNAQL